MTSEEKYKALGRYDAPNKQPILILLFGTLDYDGRAKRMVEVLNGIGPIILVEHSEKREFTDSTSEGFKRISEQLPPKIQKVCRHLYFWLTSIHQAIRSKPKLIVAENYFTGFPGWVSSKLSGAKFLYDAYELIIPELGKKIVFRSRFWYFLERWYVKSTDLVIAANEDRARLMAAHYRLKRIPKVMRNIPPRNKPCINSIKVLQKYPSLSRRDKKDRIILYQGDVSLSRGLMRFINAMDFLPHTYRFVVAGEGPDLEKLCAMARRFSCEGRFSALGRIKNDLLPAITKMADVGIICYPYEGLNNIYCAPNKMFEYAQSGLPVVSTDQPPLRKAIGFYKIGELIGENYSSEKIAKAIREVAEKKDSYRNQLNNFLQANQWESEAERIRTSVESLLDNIE